ncbi:MAG: hypothetical protein Q4G26_03580 [Paracoccus sp. (in: a-proteobacteria)]|nr:hypothetical protein [Paracoccus sp. (in: a-proteobacteria)]
MTTLITFLALLLGVAGFLGFWLVRHRLGWLYLALLVSVAGLLVLVECKPEWFLPARSVSQNYTYATAAVTLAFYWLGAVAGLVGLLVGGFFGRSARDA